ncbi:HU family DNA-binding protein [Porphyromonas gulae]|uniref:HU family DNA-binding protein n=1 Tax=Porphyromonas gulae TaxID=111105 RepID=UPI0026EE6430|nr:HU family DNA-binding protein [Porphyromonas gulae]
MAKFVMREMPDMQGTGKRTMYPKMISRGTMGPDEIAELISSQSTFSPGEVKGLVVALARTIAYGVASGYTVKIEEIGSFSASLALRKGVESEEAESGTRRNAASVTIGGVNFRPDKALIREARTRTHLERTTVRRPRRPDLTREERLSLALRHIEGHSLLRVADYCSLTGLGRTAAAEELRAFDREGRIGSTGHGTHKVYIRNKAED